MIYFLLLYGLSFVVLGVIMGLQAIAKIRALPYRVAAYLSMFGFLHGIFDWSRMFLVLEHQGLRLNLPDWMPYFFEGLLFSSFMALTAFGIEYLIAQKRWKPLVRRNFAIAALVWTLFILFLAREIRPTSMSCLGTIESIIRYTVGLFSCLVAAYALWPSKFPKVNGLYGPYERYLKLSAAVMSIYAIASGLVYVRAPEGRTALLFFNYQSATLVTAVIVLRSISAILLTFFLSLAFFIEIFYIRLTQSLQNARDEFAFSVIHDLRTSLSTMTLASELLLEPTAEGDRAKLEKLVRLIRSSAMTMKRLISDLTLDNPLETDRLALQKKRSDLRLIIGDFMERISVTITSHPLNNRLPEEPVWAEVDAARIEQVLLNLLSNADKYSDPGTAIDVELKTNAAHAIISITNRGSGIKKEELPLIFNRYYRTTSGKDRAGGYGLGLYIVRRIIEAHQGEISVESTPSKTTTFHFTLPLAGPARK